MSFEGKTAVVTGAGGGMGLNAARDLLAAGANVTLIDLKERPGGLDAGPGKALYLQGDVGDDGFVESAMAQTFEATGRLDCLVNAAGVLWFGRDVSMTEIDLDLWDEVLRIDLKSMVHTTRHAVPLMKRTGGGAMVHVASSQALRGDDKPQDAYQAAKAAIISLSKSLAIQFAADNIRSNTLIPGATESPMQERWARDPSMKARTAEGVPLGRVATTQDMANAILFLLSHRAAYITGTELLVDGGRAALP
jgi:3-oxoacyl-[acyl-carrier protein] reductase